MASRPLLLLLSLLLQSVEAFNLYPAIDDVSLATVLNISLGCMDALNTTVNCDNSLFQWTVTVDNHWWSEDNLTTLCTADCTTSADQWQSNVALACSDDDIPLYGKLVPAYHVAGRFVDGLNIACLQSDANDWCMLESLSWEGSDVIRPDCSVNPSDPSCSNPANVTAENSRIANLYNDTMLCSDCFVKLFFLRLTSDYLPDSDYSDYLVSEFQDIQDVCSTTVTGLSTRALWGYPTAFSSSDITTSTVVVASTTPTPTSTAVISTPTPIQSGMVTDCDSFYKAVSGDGCYDIATSHNITLQDFEEWNPVVGANCTGLFADYYYCIDVPLDSTSTNCQLVNTTFGATSPDALTACNQLSVLWGVSTGDMLAYTDSTDCYSENLVCVPPACELYQVPANSTCNSLIAALTVNSTIGPITKTQLLSWNPNILGVCENLLEGQYICVEAPGGSYVPPPSPTTTVDPGGEERGGPGGADPTAITGTSISYIITTQPLGSDPTAAPAPTQLGIASNCNQYSQAKDGDTCSEFAGNNGISTDDFYSWNSILGTDGSDCSTLFWAGYYYCIGTSGVITATTTSPTTTSTPAVPSPTQSGIISTCNKYAEAVAGDYCSLFAQNNDITTDELYAWNTVLGVGGEYCGTLFQANTYYCVGVSSTTSTTSTASASAPTATQSGIISTCNNYAEAVSGDYCSEFATAHSITAEQLYDWNPILGIAGANCATIFQAQTYYCVGIGSGAPSPSQPGIISTCTSYAKAILGDYCSIFASEHGITTTELYTWNPVLGTAGANCGTSFYADYWYCVSVS